MNFKTNKVFHKGVNGDEITVKIFVGYTAILPKNDRHNPLQGRINENQPGWGIATWSK